MKYIVIMGNPKDGFRFVGPFDTVGKASTYILDEPSARDFWVAPLDAPDETDTKD